MPAVPFNLPDHSDRHTGKPPLLAQQYHTNILRLVSESNAPQSTIYRLSSGPCSKRSHRRRPVVVAYHKDNDEFSAWQSVEWCKVNSAETQRKELILSPFNPHRFAFDFTNLCYLLQFKRLFRGFSSPSWYVKTPGSFFCCHVEQLFAPFYNLCYEGSTTWYVVKRDDRHLFDKYLVRRARQWYEVAENVELTTTETEAIHGLLLTKQVVFDPADLIAAGVPLTYVHQTAGTVVDGDGDLVHFGMSGSGGSSSSGSAASTAASTTAGSTTVCSVNEAVNFLPVQWLTTGLPRLVKRMRWLQTVWIPLQQLNATLCPSASRYPTQRLWAAMRANSTNILIAKHCAAHWCHAFLLLLRPLLATTQPLHTRSRNYATHRAIHQYLDLEQQKQTESVIQQIRQDIDEVLRVMDDTTGVNVREWLLKRSPVDGKLLTDYDRVK